MEMVILAWFVLNLTDSPFLVGLVGSSRLAANILAIFAGVVVDKFPRHLLLSVVGFSMFALAFLFLILLLTNTLEIWHILAIAFVNGVVRTLQMPAGQSLAADSVPPNRISNSIALLNTCMDITLIAGPIIAGVLFESFGPEGAYTLISVMYLLAGISALFIKVPRTGAARPQESVLRMVAEGLRHVKGHQVLWAGLVVAVIINLTGFPLHTTLMPIFARDVLDTDARGLGMLMSAFGVGALIGSFGLASIGNLRHVGKLLVMTVIIWHASMVVFSASTSFAVSLMILVVTGMAFSSTLVLILTALLRTARPEFRGRIMGLRVLAIYAHTFGSLNSGAMAGFFGAPMAANINAAAGIILVSLLAIIAPKLRCT